MKDISILVMSCLFHLNSYDFLSFVSCNYESYLLMFQSGLIIFRYIFLFFLSFFLLFLLYFFFFFKFLLLIISSYVSVCFNNLSLYFSIFSYSFSSIFIICSFPLFIEYYLFHLYSLIHDYLPYITQIFRLLLPV